MSSPSRFAAGVVGRVLAIPVLGFLLFVAGCTTSGSLSTAPDVTGLSQNSGAVGTTITITGTNFGATQGTSTVTFNGVVATATTWSATSIVVTVPAGATSGSVVVTVAGVAGTPANFIVPAIISGLSQISGAVGASITITGTNFGASQGTSTVTFNGTAATVTSWSLTSIVVTVPTGATTGNVVVTVSGVASNGSPFTVAASISGLSQTSGAVGVSITITGLNFGATQGTSSVTFNGTAATVTSWSTASIVVTVPTGATTGNVVVTVGGLASNGSPFTVVPPPSITSLSQISGAVGVAVTITGSNFGATQGTSKVAFNGTTATVTSWSATSIVVTVPTGATTGNVVVTVLGTASNGSAFTIILPPSITSLSQLSGTIGTSITITGLNFGATQGSSTVTFNGAAAAVTSWSVASIVVTVPAAATTGNVVVTVLGSTSNGSPFSIAPAITNLNQTSGAVGASITITGTGFGATQLTSTVAFNGTAATVTGWSATSIVVTVPAGATTGNVVVTVSGLASNGSPFTVAPSISSLSQTSGAVGVSITITGLNFGATQGTSTVTFNGTAATPSAWSATSVTVAVPTGATTGNVVVTVGTQASNGSPFTVVPPPSITSLSQISGAVGVAVTITGSNFGATQGSSKVAFNGTTATVTSWSATSIVVTVPTGATTGNVVVTVLGTASNGSAFTIILPPSITSLSQLSGTIGTSITITGLNFGATQGSSTVTFNGAAGAVTSWSATSIVVTVPAAATTGNVVVTVLGSASNGSPFSIAPAITNLNQTSGAVGASITITGTGFGATQLTSTVAFNGTAATVTSWSSASIVVTVPTGATTGNVVVTVGGLASNGSPFTVVPAITLLSQTSGAIGASITITGTSFGATQSTSTVTFNATMATVVSWSATSIVVTVPAGATTGNVVVTVGGQASNGSPFTVIPPPVISSLSQTSGAVGASITITGTNFGATQSTSTVTFNGTPATVTSWSATSIVATVPTGAATGNVVVTVFGAASNGSPFTVVPAITLLSQTSGAIGASITITGTSFGATQLTSTVTFGGTTATVVSWTATSIVVTVPAGATSGNVVVTVAGQSSNGAPFTVIPPPAITLLSQTTGSAGSSITITGANFGATQSTSTVTFNGTTATVTSWSATSIVVTVPAGATTGNVVVTVLGVASNGSPFTVVPAPSITSLSQTAGAVGVAITITGTNFGATQSTSTVTFNGTTASVTSWSAVSIVVTVPAGATTGNVVVTVLGTASNGSPFTVVAAPSITSLSQTSGAVGASITITGTNFGATQSTSTVAFNGTTATVTSWSATSIVVTVPAGATTGNVVVTVLGTASNGSPFTVVPAPAITSLSQTSGAVGLSITITGTNFGATQSTSTVKFNGTAATVTSWSAASIAVTVPAGATTGNVVVTVLGTASNGSPFTVVPAPVIANLSQTAGAIGASITITGTNFGATQSTSTVTFNGTTATVTSWSAASIVVTVPAGATTGNVVVTVLGTASNGSPFTVTSAPIITSLSQTSGAIGVSITVAGANFGATQSTSTVTFNGTAATVTSWSAASIVVTVPTGATTGNVVVNVLGTASNGSPFTVVPAPAITSLSQTSGAVGLSITITGANFGATQSTSTVTFSGTAATVTSWNATSIVVTVPAGATTGNVVVTVLGTASNGSPFTVVGAPSITSLNQTSGAVGVAITITGTNFGATQSTSTVTFNGTAATVTSWSAASIVVTVPAGATTGNVVVTVLGTASNGSPFTVVGAPSITSLSQTSGAVGVSITITGTNFGATQSTSTVKFNGTAATVTSWSAASIAVTVPAGATTGNVVVTVLGTASNGSPFTIVAAPSITSLSQTSGAVGLSITITGTNFGATQSTSTVTFNGTVATVTSWNATSIVVTVPAGATTGNVVVTVLGTASNGSPFTVVLAPAISNLSQTSGPVGASITVTGTNFGATQSTSTVTFNGTTATVTTWSATSIVVTVPAGATTGNVVVTVLGTASNGSPFTVVVVPSITSLSQTAGAVGASITITGTNFGATQSTSTVAFNGTTATVTTWSATSIVVTVPTGATTGSVVVTVAGQASNGSPFTVTSLPIITSLSQTSGAIGVSITITGANFGATQSTSTVTFNGTTAAVTSWSATSVVVTVPTGATTGNVVVNVGGQASNGSPFTVTPTCTSNCTVSGTVTGPWVEFVTVTLKNGGTTVATTTTDASGNYNFASLTAGTAYTITPSLTGYTYSSALSQPSITITLNSDATGQNFTATSVMNSYSISGFVTYSGTVTGVHNTLINVYPCTGCNPVGGTTLSTVPTGGGTFYTVRGLPAGSYIVNAEIDVNGLGVYNASNPEGSYSGTATITTSSISGITFGLGDRSAPSGSNLVAPTIQAVEPSSGAAFISYSPFQDSFGEEVGTSYKIYYGTSPSSLTSSVSLQAGNSIEVYLLSGLSSAQYYFQMSAVNSSGESTKSPATPYGPVTIGNSTVGTNSVGGTVTYTGITPSGPLYVGLYSNAGIYFQAIATPSSSPQSQAFNIVGVPNGTYQIFAIMDQNHNGYLDAGDVTNLTGANGPPPFVVSGTSSGNTITLTAANATTFVTTNHTLSGGVNSYNINVGVNVGGKLPISMTLFSGPNVAVPFDMASSSNNNDFSPIFSNSTSPTVGDLYQFLVTYSDGSTPQVITSTVNALLSSFAQTLQMNTPVAGSATVPVLNWAAPTSAPSFYTYKVSLNNTNDSPESWYYPQNSNGLPIGTLSVPYNTDGKANPNAPLNPGESYNWSVTVFDANSNSAQVYAPTLYTVPGGSISAPTVYVGFSPSGIAVNGQTTMTFTLSNPNASQSLSQVAFNDNLNSGLKVVSAGTNNCGGTPTGVSAGSTSIGLSGVSLPANGGFLQNGECTFSIVVTTSSPGVINNSASNVTSLEGGAGSSVAGSVTVVNIGAPTVTGLSASSGPVGLELTITGTNFDSSQEPVTGTFSSVSVNGVAVATSSYISWGSTSITIIVPAGAVTGHVVVNVLGVASATGPASAFTITAGSPAQLVFLTEPSNAAAGASLGPVEVAVEDLDGNINPTWSTAINLTINLPNPGNGTLSGTASIVPTNGVATFTGLSINNQATGYQLLANSTGLLGAGSSSFNITGNPASITATVPGPVIYSAATPQAVTVSITVANDVSGDVLTPTLALGSTACSLPSSTTCGQMPVTATLVSLSGGTGTYTLSYTPPTSANLTATTTFNLTVSSSLSSSLPATASFNVYPAGTRVVTVTGLGTQRIVTGTSAPANRAAVVYNDTGGTTGATVELMASGSVCPVISSVNVCGTLATGTVTTGTTTTGTTGIPFTTIPFTYTAPSTVPSEPYDRPMILAISNANPSAVGQINFAIVTTASTNMVIPNSSRLDSALTGIAVPLTASLAGDTGEDKTVVWTLAANGVPCEAPCSNAAGTLGTPTYTWNGNGVTPLVTYTPPATVPSSPDNTPTITVTSVDNAVETDSITFAIVNGACGSGNESALSGQYAFLVKGGAASNGYNAFVGGITANGVNGNGLITSGLEDINRTTGVLTDLTLTGTYSVGSDNRGCMTLTNSNGGTATFRFALGTLSGGVATQGTMALFNDNSGGGVRAEGILLKQNSSDFTVGSFNGTYVFGRDGVDAAGGHYAIAGLTTADGVVNLSNISLDYDDAIVGAVNLPGPGSGTFTVPSSPGGRATFTTTIPVGVSSTLTDHFVAYIVSPSEILSMSTDPADSTHAIQSGEIKLQTGPFTSTTLDGGNYVMYRTGIDATNGGNVVSVVQNAFTTSGDSTATIDKNDNGTEAAELVTPWDFSITATGRTTVSGSGGAPIVYLVDSTQGFVVSDNAAGTTIVSGYMQKQAAGPFSTSTASGQYALGGSASNTGSSYDTGVISFASDLLSGTLDDASPNFTPQGCTGQCGGLLPNDQITGSGAYTVSSTLGQFLSGDIFGYIISPTKAFVMQEAGSGSNTPELFILQQ